LWVYLAACCPRIYMRVANPVGYYNNLEKQQRGERLTPVGFSGRPTAKPSKNATNNLFEFHI